MALWYPLQVSFHLWPLINKLANRLQMENLKYTPNYCEENVWQLCQHPQLQDVTKRVLFISSLSRNSPLQLQKSAQGETPVWWDYHVILLASKDSRHSIYDFDSILPFPSEARHYLNSTFQEVPTMKPQDRPLFKVIEGQDYVANFDSDRSHMRDENDNWIFEPPTWPLIQAKGSMSLESILDFSNSNSQQVYTLEVVLHLLD